MRKAHLIRFVFGSAKPIHPIFAMNFLGEDCARLGPAFIPVATVGGEYYAEALPVKQVVGFCEAELSVFLVVTGVSEVVRLADLYKPRVFHATVFFIIRLGR